jgi:hypothetical protein
MPLPPTELFRQSKTQAARHGIDATMPVFSGSQPTPFLTSKKKHWAISYFYKRPV